MTSEAARTAALLTRAREALELYHEIFIDDDGTLTFRHGDVPCAVQAMQLAEGLNVLSVQCVVAWDLPDSPEVVTSVADRGGEALFGTAAVVHTDHGIDVTLRYTFPAEGLDVNALGTLFMLVVSGASQFRTDLLAGSQR
ncbi:YbjN domain-containing protein [Kibdelosporangium persicum]|uniref:Bacterial sensory transduction regulator n=1 Tax=Kibdelosporangium persicum TaxID=2698649 RepID=A0ABX2F7L3_9PSEU|nr:YbjN domain-containing protein [Kibdelosporangium persicum]NRN66808.1 putative bacterial sensory transduction regulator [Kibdelosporangium persicum]